jgi:hypothetical protein
MPLDLAGLIAEAYRWLRQLGATLIPMPYCCVVADPERPGVWDANHVDEVTAETDAEADAVFEAMERHLAHAPWRAFHTDRFTPDAFLPRLALDDFVERPPTIQMALRAELARRGASIELRPVVKDADWGALLGLVLANHGERSRGDDLDLPPEFSRQMVEVYRRRAAPIPFILQSRTALPAPTRRRPTAPA